MKAALYFKYVKALKFAFSPVTESSKATRLFMKRALAEKAITQNPSLKIFFDNSSTITNPQIDVTYADGTQLTIPTKNYNEFDILLRIGKHTQKLRRDDL